MRRNSNYFTPIPTFPFMPCGYCKGEGVVNTRSFIAGLIVIGNRKATLDAIYGAVPAANGAACT